MSIENSQEKFIPIEQEAIEPQSFEVPSFSTERSVENSNEPTISNEELSRQRDEIKFDSQETKEVVRDSDNRRPISPHSGNGWKNAIDEKKQGFPIPIL